jgi:hypothetical protein
MESYLPLSLNKSGLVNGRDYHFKKVGKNQYKVNFSVNNEIKLNLESNFNNVNFYSFLFNINKELIEKFEILNQTNNSIDFFILLNPIGKKMGIKQKYLLLNVETNKTQDDIFIINGKTQEDVLVKTHVANLPIYKKDFEQVICKYLNLSISENDKCINLNIDYEINTDEDMPLFLKNMFGTMIKNMFIKLKLFIENRT